MNPPFKLSKKIGLNSESFTPTIEVYNHGELVVSLGISSQYIGFSGDLLRRYIKEANPKLSNDLVDAIFVFLNENPTTYVRESSTMQTYQPEMWSVQKDVIYAAIVDIADGIEFADELLCTHDRDLGRSTKKNREWAETLEQSIAHMKRTLEQLKQCK